MTHFRKRGGALWVAISTALIASVMALTAAAPRDPPPAWARYIIQTPAIPVRYSSRKPRLLRGGWVRYRSGQDREIVREMFPEGTSIREL